MAQKMFEVTITLRFYARNEEGWSDTETIEHWTEQALLGTSPNDFQRTVRVLSAEEAAQVMPDPRDRFGLKKKS